MRVVIEMMPARTYIQYSPSMTGKCLRSFMTDTPLEQFEIIEERAPTVTGIELYRMPEICFIRADSASV
jgi:hypothetical protein